MSNEEAKRKLKDLIKEVLAEQTPHSSNPPRNLAQKPSEGRHELLEYLKSSGNQDKVSPRYMYSYADRPSKDILVQLNEDLLEQAKGEAKERGMSLSSYLRESLIHRLYKTTPEKELEIDQLLSNCTSQEDSERRLIIEGKEGFLNQIAEKGLTGEVWTFSQIDKVALRLRTSPKPTEEQCLQAMKLDKMQTQYFKTQVGYIRNTQPKEEELGFVPFGICDKCLSPLTKDQFNNLSNCPYCKGTKGTLFVYDKESPAQPSPCAMCAECHRPLPKESKTWKECRYCGTTKQEIVLNYDGIQRQTPSSTLTLDKEFLEKITKTERAKEVSGESEES